MIEFVAETGSTNADLVARITRGDRVAEGAWLIADRQTGGRGRQGREWRDGHGNFMGSTIAQLRFGDPEAPTLALVAGLAVRDAVARAGVEAMLKWPNDVMVGHAKLAGILLERSGDSVVIGVGVNLVDAPQLADREAIALKTLGALVDRDRFAADLARLFGQELERWRSVGLAPLVRRWLAAAHPVGTRLTLSGGGAGPRFGTFDGMTDTGAMLLRTEDGAVHVVHAGEAHFAPPRKE